MLVSQKLTERENFSIPGYSVYRYNRNHPTASGGTAILIKRNIKHDSLPTYTLSRIEAVAVNVCLSSFTMRIISADQAPNHMICPNDFQILFSSPLPIFLLGDLNSKNTILGCRTINPKGNQLWNISSDQSFLISEGCHLEVNNLQKKKKKKLGFFHKNIIETHHRLLN